MIILPAYVLRRLHKFFESRKQSQYQFVSRVFAHYYECHGSVSTMHRIMTYPNAIPKQLIHLYAGLDSPHCPPKLYENIIELITCPSLAPGQRVALHELLLEITCELPADDRELILVNTIEDVPTYDQLASICTRLLWYTICFEHKLARLSKIA